MRKHFLFLLFITAVTFTAQAQSARGVKVGYIDMEYILQNVPDYTEAKNQLEQKAQKWKQEAEVKKNEITKLKDALKTERVLLTKELIVEREEEIALQETALLDYQQKRFGPNGDLTIQKTVLTQPIQDQVFNAVQDIAEAKKYDFIFDKTSDMTMLFAAKRYDISDQVIRTITRSTKREQLSKKQLKEEEARDAKEAAVDDSPALQERQKKLDDKKAAREKLVADRKAAQQAKRDEMVAAREARKNGTKVPAKEEVSKTETPADAAATTDKKTTEKAEVETATKPTDSTAAPVTKKTKTAEERAKVLEERKKAAEERRQKILADREAAKKEKEEKKTQPNKQD